MVCKHCGEEIADESKYCKLCEAMLTPKKPIWLAVVLIVFGSILSCSGKYVDLGLPSGTKWKAENEEGGLYTYDEAVSRFGDKLPTMKQLGELECECQWEWIGDGYKVTGPNGKSIVLSAAGYRDCDGSVNDVGSDGLYWSSTPCGSEDAWYLYFNSGGVSMNYNYRCYGLSVRLVQD